MRNENDILILILILTFLYDVCPTSCTSPYSVHFPCPWHSQISVKNHYKCTNFHFLWFWMKNLKPTSPTDAILQFYQVVQYFNFFKFCAFCKNGWRSRDLKDLADITWHLRICELSLVKTHQTRLLILKLFGLKLCKIVASSITTSLNSFSKKLSKMEKKYSLVSQSFWFYFCSKTQVFI